MTCPTYARVEIERECEIQRVRERFKSTLFPQSLPWQSASLERPQRELQENSAGITFISVNKIRELTLEELRGIELFGL